MVKNKVLIRINGFLSLFHQTILWCDIRNDNSGVIVALKRKRMEKKTFFVTLLHTIFIHFPVTVLFYSFVAHYSFHFFPEVTVMCISLCGMLECVLSDFSFMVLLFVLVKGWWNRGREEGRVMVPKKFRIVVICDHYFRYLYVFRAFYPISSKRKRVVLNGNMLLEQQRHRMLPLDGHSSSYTMIVSIQASDWWPIHMSCKYSTDRRP